MATTYLGPWHGGLKNIRGLDEFLYLMIIPKNKCVTEKTHKHHPKSQQVIGKMMTGSLFSIKPISGDFPFPG